MLKILLKISEFLEKIVSIFGKFGSWLAIPLISIIIFDIITRRFFVLGSTKLQEMEWHLHTSLFLLVLGYAYLKDAHVRIEIVREKYSLKVKAVLETLGMKTDTMFSGGGKIGGPKKYPILGAKKLFQIFLIQSFSRRRIHQF